MSTKNRIMFSEKQILEDYLNYDKVSEKLRNKHNQIFRDTSEHNEIITLRMVMKDLGSG